MQFLHYVKDILFVVMKERRKKIIRCSQNSNFYIILKMLRLKCLLKLSGNTMPKFKCFGDPDGQFVFYIPYQLARTNIKR